MVFLGILVPWILSSRLARDEVSLSVNIYNSLFISPGLSSLQVLPPLVFRPLKTVPEIRHRHPGRHLPLVSFLTYGVSVQCQLRAQSLEFSSTHWFICIVYFSFDAAWPYAPSKPATSFISSQAFSCFTDQQIIWTYR